MDGAGVNQGEDRSFPLKVAVDPIITDNKDDTELYVNHPPCTGGVINIKVIVFSAFCLHLKIHGNCFFGEALCIQQRVSNLDFQIHIFLSGNKSST